MHNSRLMLAIGLAILIASLAGCAGKIRYPNFYVLNVSTPVPAPVESRPVLGAVAVRQFTAPAFLRGGSIAYRPSPERIDFYAYSHWAEDPRPVVTSALIRALKACGMFQSVQAFDGHGTPDYLVTGTLDHLEEVDQGSAVSVEVGLSAQLTDLKTGVVVWQDMSSKTARVDQRSIPGMVAEMSRDMEFTVNRLVSSMQNRLSKSKEN